MGRPKTGRALSTAERMRRYRARRRTGGAARAAVLRKADLIRSLARAHGAQSVALFGSAARGEEHPGSDLDFMVELAPGRSLLDLISLGTDWQAALGRREETFSAGGMKPRVLSAARKDAIRIV